MMPFASPMFQAVVAASPPQLIVNPGAEMGDMTGWTQNSGGPASSIGTIGGGYPGSKSGSRYFVAGGSAPTSNFSQTIDIPSSYHSDIDAGLIAVELVGFHAGSFSAQDSGSLTLECLDAASNVLATYTPIMIAVTVDATWYERRAKLAAPGTTRKIRIGTTNAGTGSVIDSYWDDFSLSFTQLKTLWTNAGGAGDRTGSIAVTATNIAIGGGSPSNLVNGSQDNSFWWTNATGDGTGFIAFDFGSPRIVDAFRWLQQTNNAHGIWRLEGSNNNAGTNRPRN